MLLNWRTGLHVDKDKVGLVEFSGLREKNTETQPHNFCFAPPRTLLLVTLVVQ